MEKKTEEPEIKTEIPWGALITFGVIVLLMIFCIIMIVIFS